MDSWLLTLRSESVFMRYMKLSHWETAMPNCFLTAWASKLVLCGTLMALEVPLSAIESVFVGADSKLSHRGCG